MKASLFVLTCFCLPTFASIGFNPALSLFPEKALFTKGEHLISVKGGYVSDFTYKMHLKSKAGNHDARLKKWANLGACGVCFSDLVDIYAFLGQEFTTIHYKNEKNPYKFKDNGYFSYALYGSGILNQWGRFQFAISGFYSAIPNHKGTLYSKNGSSSLHHYYRYNWGFGLATSYDNPKFSPYLRLDFQKTKVHIHAISYENFKVLHPVGVTLGFTVSFTKRFFIDLSGQFIQENGIRLFAGTRI